MQHKEPLYVRKGKTITNVKTGQAETHSSISAAKRRSLTLQRANGGRGMGAVRVER